MQLHGVSGEMSAHGRRLCPRICTGTQIAYITAFYRGTFYIFDHLTKLIFPIVLKTNSFVFLISMFCVGSAEHHKVKY
jgi:hypothetical protein